MLDLNPRVELEEAKASRIVVDDKFDCPGRTVLDQLAEPDGRLAHIAPKRRVAGDKGAASLLEHLLVPALDRALALAKLDDTAGAVAKDLDLDVSSPPDVLLKEDAGVGEERLCQSRASISQPVSERGMRAREREHSRAPCRPSSQS